MVLRSKTIRLGIFISTLILAAIVVFQLVWLKKVYRLEQKEFDHSILKAVRNFLEDVDSTVVGNTPAYLSDLVKRNNPQTYLVRFSDLNKFAAADFDTFAQYMQAELEDQEIFTDCSMSLYSGQRKQSVFQAYLPAPSSDRKRQIIVPKIEEPFSCIILYFPYRNQYILTLMNAWLITSAMLLVVLILLSGSLYYFYRQTFLSEMQRDFINNFTHEFKTPVSVISLAAETLASADIHKKPERLMTYAGIVKYQSQYLQEQINRLLHYAYAEANQLQLKKDNVSFHLLIEEALENLQPLIQSTGACIECQFQATNDKLLSDKGYLLIVLINLIENALKYAKQPKVIIATANEGHSIVFSVKDNGKGIPAKFIRNIFKRFYRVTDGDEAFGRGFGLGLSFVKRIVDAHHGRVWVESIPDVGSNFTVKIPAA